MIFKMEFRWGFMGYDFEMEFFLKFFLKLKDIYFYILYLFIIYNNI